MKISLLQEIIRFWNDNTFKNNSNSSIVSLRVLEEAIELCQSEDVPVAVIQNVIDQVYSKPKGNSLGEIADIIIVTLNYANAINANVDDVVSRKLEYIMRNSSHIREKNDRKIHDLSSVS